MQTGAALGVVAALLTLGAEAKAGEPESAANEREREAQYRRNHLTLGLAANRSHASGIGLDADLWIGRLEGAYMIPLSDGAGPLWAFRFGLGGGPVEDGFLFTLPTSFAYGFRTPAIIGYAGGTVGVGGGSSEKGGDAGLLVGALAALGVSATRVSLLFEARVDFVPLRAGQSLLLWGYGPVVMFVL
jgi:hypothetical protein